MPPTVAAVANNNAAMRRNRNNNASLTNAGAVQLTTQQNPQPYFLGAPITKLLCMIWIVGSLVVIRSNRNNNTTNNGPAYTNDYGVVVTASQLLTSGLVFHTTSELVVGGSFLAHYLRRLERALSSRRLVVLVATVHAVVLFLQVVALSTLDGETVATFLVGGAKGPYAMVGAVLYWYGAYVPRIYPRFVSLQPVVDMNFSEKTFGLAWASYVLLSQGVTASLVMGALGMVGSAVFFFLLTHLKLSMDVPDTLVNMLPWDSIGNLLLLDNEAKVFAPLLVVQRDDTAAFGGMGAAFAGRPRPRPRRPAAQPAPAAAPPPEPPAEAVAQLTAMGFEEARVKEALQVSGNNIERAANILLTG